MVKKILFSFICFVFAGLSSTASAWTVTASFDSGEIGDKAERTSDGFHGAAGLSTYSEAVKLKGGSVRIAIKEGMTGFGSWGGEFRFPEKAYRGETIWYQVYVYFPEDFDYYSYGGGGRLKFLRIQTFDSFGKNDGYNDLYIDKKGSENPFKWIYEGEQRWVNVGASDDLPRKGVWESYQMAVTLDTVPTSEGGSAMVRVWKNGELLSEIKNRKTLSDPNGYSNRALLFTYWNGGAPKDQHMYVDEVTITNDKPGGEDEAGNIYLESLIVKRPRMD